MILHICFFFWSADGVRWMRCFLPNWCLMFNSTYFQTFISSLLMKCAQWVAEFELVHSNVECFFHSFFFIICYFQYVHFSFSCRLLNGNGTIAKAYIRIQKSFTLIDSHIGCEESANWNAPFFPLNLVAYRLFSLLSRCFRRKNAVDFQTNYFETSIFHFRVKTLQLIDRDWAHIQALIRIKGTRKNEWSKYDKWNRQADYCKESSYNTHRSAIIVID